MLYGKDVKITPELIPDVSKQSDVMATAADAGRLLGKQLRDGHDRKASTGNMQQKMKEMQKSSA